MEFDTFPGAVPGRDIEFRLELRLELRFARLPPVRVAVLGRELWGVVEVLLVFPLILLLLL